MMASRICVKNLPKECQEKQLAKHFEQFGPFTDVKLIRTQEGVSRGFGFIGFVDTTSAMKAMQYFDKSFIGTRRISVELARKVGDTSLSRPWSKYSKGSSSFNALHRDAQSNDNNKAATKSTKKSTTSNDAEVEKDIQLQEFLDLMMPQKKQDNSRKDTLTAAIDVNWETQNKRKRKTSDDQGEDGDMEEATFEQGKKRLFVRNLPYGCSESDLVELFSPYGDMHEVHVAIESKNKKTKGFAFVEFEETSSASMAMAELDGSIFQGRLLHILPSYDKRQKIATDPQQETTATSAFKKEKEAKLKETIGNRAAWNTFYIRPDAITDAVAEYYQVTKSELMDRDASDLGVRLALGETQILARIKEDLENGGIDVSKLEKAAQLSGKAASKKPLPRHNDCIILKNLPYDAKAEELEDMFQQFGEVTKFVMPTIRVMAIVQYAEATDAQNAFRSLAYRKYKSVPIYLEWAPFGLFANLAQRENGGENTDGGENRGVTIYVKNLSFSTKDVDLAKHFDLVASEVGGLLRSAKVARRTHRNGTIVSAGFGFVELDSEDVAKHVLRKLQNSELDGHLLQLRRSRQQPVASILPATQLDKDAIQTKLIVKNLAFECTRQDLLQLFSPYGQVQRCRFPKKFDGQHRGFAFVEFVTKHEAKQAMERVTGAHLYGRRLVVEFAKSEDGSLRKNIIE